jgi:uncharacterized protein
MQETAQKLAFQGVATYVVKVASRCNLNCSYCYMYNMGDDTFMNQPKKMKMSTVEELSHRLNEHVKTYGLPVLIIAFHGGEPLLWGVDNIVAAKNKIMSIVQDVEIVFSLQTNGLLLDDLNTKTLIENGIQIGISLDGIKEVHDKYRVDHKGRGSFDDIVEKFQYVRKYQHQVSIITVLSLELDPEAYIQFLLDHEIDGLNLILLEANYDKLPPGYNSVEDLSQVLYGKWLARLFDAWVKGIDKKRIKVDIFDLILGLLMGERVGNQFFGQGVNDVITIETNGAIETVDILRITENGITRNDLNVGSNSIADLINEEIFSGYYFAHHNLCNECKSCSFKDICGGGMFVHRYKSSNGFDNPSVYCQDIKYIVSYINDYLNQLAKLQ